MPKTEDTISRFDLVAAGTNFYVEKFSSNHDPESFALPLCSRNNITYGDVEGAIMWITLHPACDFVTMTFYEKDAPSVCFKSSIFNEVRKKLSDFLRLSDPVASDALRMTWNASGFLYWPSANWATAHGFNLNALAYSAVQKRDVHVVRMYLDAGANSMARTCSGDSAARLGVANGMLDLFGRQEFLDIRSEEAGETGLFDLAREIDIDGLKVAYRMGADPEIKNIRGQTVLDLLDPTHQDEMLAVIAEAQAKKLREIVPGCLPPVRTDGMRRRL